MREPPRAPPVDPRVALAGFLSLALECPWTLDAEMIYVPDVFGRTRSAADGEGFLRSRPPLGRHYFLAKGDRVIGGGVRWGFGRAGGDAGALCMYGGVRPPLYYIRCSCCVYEILGAPWVIIIISLPLVYILLLLLKYNIPFQFARRKNFRFPFIRTDGVWA